MNTTSADSVLMNDAMSPQSQTAFNEYLMCDVYGDVVNHPLMGHGDCGPEPNNQGPAGVIDLEDLEECEMDFKPEIPDRQLESFEGGYSPAKYPSIPASQPRVEDQHEDVLPPKSFGLHGFGILLGYVWETFDYFNISIDNHQNV